MKTLSLIVEAAAVVLSVDFVSGLVHWAEDTFWSEETPVVGRWIVKPNVLHHRDGSAFTGHSWLESSWDLLAAGALILGVAWLLNLLSWQVWLFVVAGVNANQIHKWAHLGRTKAPVLVRAMQRVHLLQSPAHHARHHRGDKNTDYCVVTEVLNPLLDSIGFWRALERVAVPDGGAPRRADIQTERGAACG